MTSIVLGSIGAVVGGMMGNPGLGWSIGSSIGGMLEDGPNTDGPRLSDLKVQGSTYGSSIPIYYGTARGAGQVIWSSDLIEVANEEEMGGKGGGPTYTSYTYFVNCAVAVCEGEISGISRIWANGKLIYDVRPENGNATGASSNIRVYTGSETQNPDSLLESYLGAGNVPAHRGLAYVVFQNFALADYGNRLPNFTFEVVNNGTLVIPSNQTLTNEPFMDSMPHPFYDDIYLFTTQNDDGLGTNMFLHVVDAVTKTDTAIKVYIDSLVNEISGHLMYVEYGVDILTGAALEVNEIWVSTDRSYASYTTSELAVAFDVYSLSFKRRINPGSFSGMAWPKKFLYDKSNYQVVILNSSSTISDGARYLEPYSVEWTSGTLYGAGLNWFTGPVIPGKNIQGAINYTMYLVLFSSGVLTSLHTGTPDSLYGWAWTYDTRRERWIGISRQVGGLAVFRAFQEDPFRGFPMEDIYTSNTNMSYDDTLTYWPVTDKLYCRDGNSIKVLNAETCELEKEITRTIGKSQNHPFYEVPSLPDYGVTYIHGTPTYGAGLVPLEGRISAGTAVLGDIVTDICNRVDLSVDDIVTAPLTDIVDGYIITQQMTARAAIESLQAGYFFDAVESD